jgi:uncharacterized protein (UPF0297 family)
MIPNLPKEYYIDFDTLKVGDKVWDIMKGEVEITNVKAGDEYTIATKYDTFTKEGKNHINSLIPRLYSKNPFELLNNQERVILVRNFESEDWEPRVLIMYKNERAVCWTGAETIEEAKLTNKTTRFKFWKELEEPKELTLEEKFKNLKELMTTSVLPQIKKLEELLIK